MRDREALRTLAASWLWDFPLGAASDALREEEAATTESLSDRALVDAARERLEGRR